MKINRYKTRREFEILTRIYALYDETMQNQKTICQKGCAACCTCNVTMTGLEAALLADALDLKAKKALKEAVNSHFPANRFILKTTTNQFARLCMEGKPVLEEENDPAWGKCPALKSDVCSIYEARPFGCRALMSTASCADQGYAQISPEIVTINTVFMQAIEHLDQKGISGNFSDIMQLFLDENPSKNESPPIMTDPIENIRKNIKEKGSTRFSANEKITVLMIEPEHRKKLTPLVQTLSSFLK